MEIIIVYYPVSAADADAVSPNDIKMLLADGVSTFH